MSSSKLAFANLDFSLSMKRILDVNKCVDIMHYTNLQNYLCSDVIVATATSERHCKAMAEYLVDFCKSKEISCLSSVSSPAKFTSNDWIIVDCEGESTIIHVMVQAKRDYYGIDSLLAAIAPQNSKNVAKPSLSIIENNKPAAKKAAPVKAKAEPAKAVAKPAAKKAAAKPAVKTKK